MHVHSPNCNHEVKSTLSSEEYIQHKMEKAAQKSVQKTLRASSYWKNQPTSSEKELKRRQERNKRKAERKKEKVAVVISHQPRPRSAIREMKRAQKHQVALENVKKHLESIGKKWVSPPTNRENRLMRQAICEEQRLDQHSANQRNSRAYRRKMERFRNRYFF